MEDCTLPVTLARILSRAVRAPSGDNCQPWRFEGGLDGLRIFREAERARHLLNPHGAATALSLGALLRSLALAARPEGYRVDWTLAPPNGDLLATVHFAAQRPENEPLIDAIAARTADRRPYLGGRLDGRLAEAWAGEPATVGIHPMAALSPTLRAWMRAVDLYPLRHADIYRDILRWMRTSPAELARHQDGVPFAAMGLRAPSLPLPPALRAHPLSAFLGRRGAPLWAAWNAHLLDTSAGVLLFTTRRPAWASLVEVGATAMGVWLRLVAQGWAAQPMTVQSTTVYDHCFGGLPPGREPELVARYDQGVAVLRAAFALDEQTWPVWMLRVGRAPLEPAPARTPRRALSSIWQR
jgi:hypothetical protein